MGNTRKMLKENITDTIKNKITLASTTLNQLSLSLEEIEKNSLQAKVDVQEKVDELTQEITLRKIHLLRQIDLFSHAQINSIQGGIQATLLALGSLQTILSNMDTFDQSQLLNLNIPDITWMETVKIPKSVETSLECAKLKESLGQWGKISAPGLRGLIDFKTSNESSLPPRFVDYSEGTKEQMFNKPVSPFDASQVFVKITKLPHPHPPSISTHSDNASNSDKENSGKTVYNIPKDGTPPDSWHVHQWLYEIKSQTCLENDDFEMVSVDTEENSSGKDKISSSIETLNEVEANIFFEEDTEENNDLSKWLIKNNKVNTANTITINIPPPSPSAKIINENSAKILEFPCLDLDPKIWYKNQDESQRINYLTENLSINPKRSEFIPPTFELPHPYWLKKYSF